MSSSSRLPLVGALQFRRAFRRVPGPVAVVLATTDSGTVQGITCTSASSLSADPPMAMFSVDVKTRFVDVVGSSGRFSINYLADDRDGWAVAFSRGGSSLAELSHVIRPGRTGVPTLGTGTAVVLECSVDQTVRAGDHWIVTGLINHVRAQSDAELLVYMAGRYGRFAADAPIPQSSQPIAHL